MTTRLWQHRGRLLWLLGLGLLILLFFHRLAFSGLILARGDTFLYFYPYWQAATDALRDGRLPLWNPHLFLGAPLLANSQMGFFYPLNWPLWYWLPVPYAVSATILIHLWIAGIGTYLAARRSLALSPAAAFLAATLFALGGYLTAQVEHVNQLQGLAWLPWFFVVLGGVKNYADGADKTAKSAQSVQSLILVSLLFALQLGAGHTQTAFISGVGAGLWLLVAGPLRPRAVLARLWPLAAGAALAAVIAAAQLLPTLELTSFSSRQGGLSLNEALSFSLHPLLAGQALLPGYSRALFSEYVAFLPLTALLLAGGMIWSWRTRPALRPWLLLTAAGLLFALGQFNPFYWLLAHLPGFGYFRAPARWLVLYALGAALLAGAGWDSWRTGKMIKDHADSPDDRAESGPATQSLIAQSPLVFAPIILLLIWTVAAVPLGRLFPVAPESPLVWPNGLTLLGWGIELGPLLVLLWLPRKWGPWAAVPLMLAVLFLSGRSLPYHNVTTPEAYFDQRPPSLRLQAAALCPESEACPPPDRFLSLSQIFFDPGDQAEIDTIYSGRLSAAARYDYTVAIKQKEIIAPNLPLVYGLAAVDGYDGGILPLLSYSEFVASTLLSGRHTGDGRLREFLTAVPDNRWLNLMNVRYLITDKVGDRWYEGVFFDLQHEVKIVPQAAAAVSYLPAFEATEIWLVAGDRPGGLVIASGDRVWRLAPQPLDEPGFWRVLLPEPAIATGITLSADTSAWSWRGMSLVDGRDGAFQPLTVGPYRLIHSGDVKIYENLPVLPRAFMVDSWRWQPDRAAALAELSDPAHDFARTAVLTGSGLDSAAAAAATAAVGQATIVHYAPERVAIAVSGGGGLLVLTDAYYPGWTAVVDGEETAIYEANGFFRAVFVPDDAQEVVFHYQPLAFDTGAWVSAAGLLLWLALLFRALRLRLANSTTGAVVRMSE
jgi:hypothetical protein